MVFGAVEVHLIYIFYAFSVLCVIISRVSVFLYSVV